jgi:hypothetical protein
MTVNVEVTRQKINMAALLGKQKFKTSEFTIDDIEQIVKLWVNFVYAKRDDDDFSSILNSRMLEIGLEIKPIDSFTTVKEFQHHLEFVKKLVAFVQEA